MTLNNALAIFKTIVNNSTRAVLSVYELNRRAKKILETELPLLWVRGELSTVSKPASGHWYFTLKDDRAQIRCAMFVNANRSCKIDPQQGMEVLLSGRISLYEGRGDYQIIVNNIEASGIGALHHAFELLKQQLFAEGLFDKDKKLTLPQYPKGVALITSDSGAAIADMIHSFNRRAPIVDLVVLPVIVQGKQAVPSLLAMLNKATTMSIDLIIIGRGGGSMEDLWAFNDEQLARTLAKHPIPSISAVGHEIDRSISDYAASATAITPTAAAELATQHWLELSKIFESYCQLLQQKQILALQLKKQRLNQLKVALISPTGQLREQSQRLDYLYERLLNSMTFKFKQLNQKLSALSAVIEAMAPKKVLERGYSILMDGKHPITSVKQLSNNQKISALLKDGQSDLQVIK